MTLIIMTFSILTLGIMHCYADFQLCSLSFMLSGTYKHFMLSVVKLSVVAPAAKAANGSTRVLCFLLMDIFLHFGPSQFREAQKLKRTNLSKFDDNYFFSCKTFFLCHQQNKNKLECLSITNIYTLV
jgi:hypothetical protein